jgi:NitT/TauT family transport system substrate-binding protein
MMKKLICLLTLAAIATVCSAQDVVRLGNQKFAHYGAVSYMKEIAAKYNLKIEERIFAKGLDIIPAYVAGEVDISASGMDGVISGRASGAAIYVVAGFSRGGIRILERTDADYKSVAELKGKKVGVTRGGAMELALLAEFQKYNLTYSDQPGKDVQLYYMAYADLNQALAAKNLDAICQSEPQSSQAINKGFGKEIIKPYDTPMGEPIRALAMSEKLYKEKPDVAYRVMKCFVEATKYFIENPKAAEKYVVENLFKGQITSQDYQDAMSNAAFNYDVTVENVQITSDYMVKCGVGKLNNPPPAKDYVKTDLLIKAKKELGVK